MPTSSSAKKVARVAARSGSGNQAGAKAASQRNWLFALGILAIVGLGLGLVVFARQQNVSNSKNDTPPRANLSDGKPSDHWHSAFAMNVCGKELPFIAQPPDDPNGIHTHGDGLIHIHPFNVGVAGKRARMSVFWDLVNLKVTNTGFKDPNTGKVYQAGKTTCAGKPTRLVMAFWKDGEHAQTNPPDKIYTKDFATVNFTVNLSAYTLALVPVGDNNIPAPSSAATIQQLGSCDGANPPPSCPTSTTPQGTTPNNVTVPPATPGTTVPAAPATTVKPKGSG